MHKRSHPRSGVGRRSGTAVAALLGAVLASSLALGGIFATAPSPTGEPATALEGGEFPVAPTPVIQGYPRFGEWARVDIGTWSPEPMYMYKQWLLDGKVIIGATADRYSPLASDIGKQLSFRVTAYRGGYADTTRTSYPKTILPDPRIKQNFTAKPKPKVSGTAKVGKRLTAKAGAWKPGTVTLRYQWLRNGKAIKGATKSKYKLTRKDRGKRISVRVTGKKSGYVTVSRTSSSKRVR